MRTYTVRYISLAGRDVSMTVEAESEDDAISKAWAEDAEFSSSDNIHQIIDVDCA
jgi:hypothetical protein